MINVFVCTYNPNKEILKRTVDAILGQDLENSFWDLTIIDNNSTSPVREIDFIKANNINVVEEKVPGLTAARKCAAANGSGDIMVFVDDDNILKNNYLSVMLDIFSNNNISIVSGDITPEYKVTPEKWFYPFQEMVAIRAINTDKLVINQQTVFNDFFPVGAGMGIKRQVLVDYFNIHLSESNTIEGRRGNDLSSCEDIDIDFYALSKGYKIGVSPHLKLVHLIPEGRLTINYITRLAKSATKSSFQVNCKWRPFFSQNVFTMFDIPYRTLVKNVIIYKLFSFKKHYKVQFAIFSAILNCRLSYKK